MVYTSKTGFAGTDNFSYTIRDSFGRTATATVTVTVTPPGLNAVDDAATTPARTSVTIPVLANDTGTGIAIAGVGTPSNGTASISGNAVVYAPNSNFAGTDSFGYTIRDSFGQTDTATVRVRVTAPTLDAVDDTASARTRTPVVIPVSVSYTHLDVYKRQQFPPCGPVTYKITASSRSPLTRCCRASWIV